MRAEDVIGNVAAAAAVVAFAAARVFWALIGGFNSCLRAEYVIVSPGNHMQIKKWKSHASCRAKDQTTLKNSENVCRKALS